MDSQDGKLQALIGEESNILERVARIISSVRGAKPDYAHLAAELEPALPFDIFGIVLLRHDRLAVRVTVCRKSNETWVAHHHQHPFVDSMVERVAHHLTPEGVISRVGEGNAVPGDGLQEQTADNLLVQNFSEGANGLPVECGDALCGHPQLRAALIAPLIAGGKLLGTLELGSVVLDAYGDPALQRLIHAIARVLATAIEGAQVGGNVEIQNRQRQELKNVSTALTSAVDFQMILERIVTGITNALHIASAIVRFDRLESRLCLETQSGLDGAVLEKVLAQQAFLSEETIIGSTLLHRQSRVSQDIAQDERFPSSRNFATNLFMKSIFCYPLITGKYIYGALLLLSPEPGGFTPLKIDISSLFADQATVAIQNGLLLQSASERRRFQEAIEQLERATQQNVFADQDEAGEQELLKILREETLNTFGVSLGSVLRFIGNHLLTRSERHLQDILRSSNGEASSESRLAVSESALAYSEGAMFLAHASDIEQFAHASGQEGMTYLMDAAADALAHTDLLSDISAALMHALKVDEAHPRAYEQLKAHLAEPWFIVDLNGSCLYVNRAAEVFCGRYETLGSVAAWHRRPAESQTLFSTFHSLSKHQETGLELEQVFDAVLPHVRELRELLAYLREFKVNESAHKEFSEANEADEVGTIPRPLLLRCTVAAEPLPGQIAHTVGAQQSVRVWSVAESTEPRSIISPPRNRLNGPPTMLLDSTPSDRHYQFIRHALYDEYGHWFANALHIHDMTEQVRDEKNKSVLLASVSHDLRTPLTTIKAAVTGLLQPDVVWDEDVRREILEDIDTETDHLHTLVNALVEMSRIEMGALSLDKEWCDIVELVYTTLHRSQRMLADFTLETHIQSPLPLIYADYAQLERVLYNLLENAARHSPRHTVIGVDVGILAQKDLPAGMPEAVSRAIRVQVVDQGQGVPEEERERIFKSFYSLDAQGNGLGLAICRGIVEAHQGRIWVEEQVEGGSCFVFVLPITS